MDRREEIKGLIKGITALLIGFLAGIICIVEYYPFLPAVMAVMAKDLKKYRKAGYTGIVFAISFSMPIGKILKYSILLIMIYMAVNCIIWANGYIKRIYAGIITGILTTGINLIDYIWMDTSIQNLILGMSEALFAMGTVVFLSKIFGILGMLWNQNVDHTPGIVGQDRRVLNFVTALEGLSGAFKTMGITRNMDSYDEEDNLKSEITGRVCAACEGCDLCWNQNQATLSGEITSMVKAVLRHEQKEDIIEKSYVGRCQEYPSMVEEAINAFGRMEINKAWYKRLLENRIVIAQQLDAMTGVLENWSSTRKNVDSSRHFLRARLKAEARENNIILSDLHLYQDKEGRLIIDCFMKSKVSGQPLKPFVNKWEKISGIKFRTQKECKSLITTEPIQVILYQDVDYYVLTGISTQKKNSSVVSGDNFAMFDTDEGFFHICLSDGMGSGSRACQESELVVDLMEKFIEAGFESHTAIRLMNSAMVLQGENSSFSTLDYGSLNLYTGELELTKIGAAPTFIKRGDEVSVIDMESLPAGVDIEQKMENTTKSLRNGDFLVMVTDGVLEYLNVRNPKKRLSDIIRDVDTDNAGVLAQKILDKVLLDTGGYVLDDMTVLVIALWEK